MIFYYSCTGNTAWAAQRIGEALGEALITISETTIDQTFTLKPGETIGFCFPIHAWRPPMPVREFARKCRISNAEGHYCWMLCTAGDDIGEAVDIMQRDLSAAHLQAVSVFSLLMPNTYVGLPLTDVDKDEVVARKLAQSEKRLDGYIRHIQNHDCGLSMLDLSRWPRINSRLLGHLFVKHLISDKSFTVDSDACLRCGRCEQVCPESNIQLDDDRHPVWLHNGRCLTCFACYHHCPAKAINWGKATKGKGQYYYNRKQKQ
ncbi:MAG: EFR1 family ferrodoxin [Prevotella sp.]|nr:EFR1 family ferrodoxin [Prevotella sp.]